jgi:hypothetical protein
LRKVTASRVFPTDAFKRNGWPNWNGIGGRFGAAPPDAVETSTEKLSRQDLTPIMFFLSISIITCSAVVNSKNMRKKGKR